MKFKEIVAITGMPGLFQLVATKSDGAIVKNIDDGISKFVPARSHNVTTLEGIEVYTEGDNMRLWEVFQRMKETKEAAGEIDIAKADNNAVKAYFKVRFPEFDQDRVYVSDMKKMLKWYNILEKHNLLNEETTEEVKEEVAVENNIEEVTEMKPKKTTKAKKEENDSSVEATEEKKPRKPRAKKTEE